MLAELNCHQATLLFVDDELNILSSLKRLFRPQGYNIIVATSGPEALALMKEEKIDLVISDMRMPEMSGAEFLEEVAKNWPETIRLLLTGYADMSSTVDAINKGRIYQYISKPWDDHDIKVAVEKALQFKLLEEERNQLLDITEKQNEELKSLNENLDYKIKQRTSELEQAMGMLDVAYDELKKNFKSSIEAFTGLVEMRGKLLAGHARRTAKVSKALALKLGMDEDQAEDIMYAGLLHDVGKIGFPDRLLNKPVNEMSEDDLSIYKRHPVVGELALFALESFGHVSKLVRHHHENYDGSGFPDGLAGEDIPIGSRILLLVNDYDSLCSGTMFSSIKGQEEARSFVTKNINSRYDPAITETFFKLIGPAKKEEIEIKKIGSRSMLKGMVLAKDLINKEGLLLLSEGFVLDESVITRMILYEETASKKLDIYVRLT